MFQGCWRLLCGWRRGCRRAGWHAGWSAIGRQAASWLSRPPRHCGRSAGRGALIQLVRHVDDWRFVMRQLGGLRAPALLAWGERDSLYGLPAAERLRRDIPGARLITIAGAGHLLPVERPIELAAEMRRFLLGHV